MGANTPATDLDVDGLIRTTVPERVRSRRRVLCDLSREAYQGNIDLKPAASERACS